LLQLAGVFFGNLCACPENLSIDVQCGVSTYKKCIIYLSENRYKWPVIVAVTVPAAASWHKGSSAPSIRSLAVDTRKDEAWLESMFRLSNLVG